VEIYPDSAARRQWKTFAPHHRAVTVPMDVDEDGGRTKEEPEELTLPSVEEIYDDFLNPSIRPPYLPFKTVEYSCRPNGPKLYDILGAESLERFGILAWSIIDREEELFEMDGVRDEDKVMQALWCRWIMLNRRVSLQVEYPLPSLTFPQAETFHPELFGRYEAVHKGEPRLHKMGSWMVGTSSMVIGKFPAELPPRSLNSGNLRCFTRQSF